MNNRVRNALFESTEVKAAKGSVEAIEYLEEYLGSNDLSEEEQTRINTEIALLYFREDMYLEAMQHIEKALEIDRNNPSLNYFAARTSALISDYMMIEFYLNTAKSLDSKYANARYFLAVDRKWNEKYPKAINEFLGLLQLRPELHFLKKMIGVCLFKNENYGDSAFYLKQYVEIFPEDVEANFYLGASLKELGDVENAIKHLQMVVGCYLNVSSATRHLVELYLDKWEFDMAENLVNTALERKPGDEDLLELKKHVKERKNTVGAENSEFVKIIEKVNGL